MFPRVYEDQKCIQCGGIILKDTLNVPVHWEPTEMTIKFLYYHLTCFYQHVELLKNKFGEHIEVIETDIKEVLVFGWELNRVMVTRLSWMTKSGRE